MGFQSSFFSVAGQKERLANVRDVLTQVVIPKPIKDLLGIKSTEVKATTASPLVNKALEIVVKHPYETAAVGAIAAKPKVAIAAAKEVISKGKEVVQKVTGKTATKTLGTATVAGSAAKIGSDLLKAPNQVIIPGQPMPITPIIAPQAIPGQPSISAPYAMPSYSGTGQSAGSPSLPVGEGLSTQVMSAVTGQPLQTVEYQQSPYNAGASTFDNTSGFITGLANESAPMQTANQRRNAIQRQISLSNYGQAPKSAKKKKASKTKRSKGKRRSKKGKLGTNRQYFKKAKRTRAQKRGGLTVHYNRNGQPYVKLANGMCRFIKKTKR